MSTSLVITAAGLGPNAYPGLVFDPNESAAALYHEDREIDGVMYRAINAMYNGSTWSCFDHTQSAYAITQNPDNSIGHVYHSPTSMSWHTSDWLGTPNIGIFHAADYGLSVSDALGVANRQALQDAIDAAAKNLGGIVYIAAGTYSVSGTVSIPPVYPDAPPPNTSVGFMICGADAGTHLMQLGASSHIFLIEPDANGDNNEKRVLFKRIRFSFAAVDVNGILGPPYAVYSTAAGVICQECYFADGPAMYMGGEHNGLSYCIVNYDVDRHTRTNGAQLVVITGSQDFVDHTEIRQNPQNEGLGLGPLSCVGIVIQTVSTCFISNVHVADLDTGIWVQGGGVKNLLHTFIANVSCQCWSYAVRVQPNISGGFIYQVFFDNCSFGRSQDSPGEDLSGNPLPGILVALFLGDTDNSTLTDISFANCISHDWAGAGLEVRGGEDIIVTGGRFAANATDALATTSGGISVTGLAQRVLITGADCSGRMSDYASRPSGGHVQPYGISVSAAVNSMRVRGCILGNNGSGPLHVSSGSNPDLEVVDCSGYNDQATTVTMSVPSSGFNGTTATSPYWGPVMVYASGASGAFAAKIGKTAGTATTLPIQNGSFYLGPGEFLYYTGAPAWSALVMIGN